jgi:hypothetical protein
MVQMFFSLRFQSQLRRTRPKLLRNLEKSIVDAIEGFGGKVRIEHKLISASFDSESIGFWLDMFCVLEAVKNALAEASSELYGHICIVSRDIPEEDVPFLARSLPSDLWGTGIWCSPEIKAALESFIDFDDPPLAGDSPGAKYVQIRFIRKFEGAELRPRAADNSEKIRQYLKQGPGRNTVIVGEENTGKWEGLYRYCTEQMDGFSPLVIRFFPGMNAVTAFADALSPEIKAMLEDSGMKELERLGEILFGERLRDELPEFIIRCGERFFLLLLKAYRAGAEQKGVKPALVLENIQDAAPLARRTVVETCLSLPPRERCRVYGTCTRLKALAQWEDLFPRIIKFTPGRKVKSALPELPRDLWEMGYCCRLFSRYFPDFLLPRLFREEGKNPVMVEKALDILSRLRINDEPDFADRAEQVLGGRTEAVRRVVRNRLLAWVETFRLKPCYRFLGVLAGLGAKISESLMLDAICGDIVNGTCADLEKAIRDGTFESVIGKERAPALLAIFKTQWALNHGGKNEIRDAFRGTVPSGILLGYPEFKARIAANTAAYYLGICDTAAAENSVKEAMLLAQNENKGRLLAQVYRLFSLVEFSNHHLSDAIDYFAFAVENAEKSEDLAELGISAYYAAGAHFIFGNLSKAKRLATQAREAAQAAILPDWADRSRFLEARLCFETGCYREALDIFKDLESNYLGKGTKDFKQTLAAWIFRTNVYLHTAGVSHSGGQDARLFEVEAAFIAGEYKKAFDLSNELEKTGLVERFLLIEQPDWRSGFCQCELMLFSLRDLWDRMIHTYRALAVCHMGGDDDHDQDRVIRELQRVMRDELPETDPNDAFYFYAYYRILKRTNAPEVDMNTAVSIAFKRLQRRASRIDDNETKRAFQNYHYWNSALTVAAKEHKLI